MKFIADKKSALSFKETMAPDEGYSHFETLMTVTPFIYIQSGKYYPALEIEFFNEKQMAIIDDSEAFDSYAPAGKKSYELKAAFKRSFAVLCKQIIFPNIEAFASESD